MALVTEHGVVAPVGGGCGDGDGVRLDYATTAAMTTVTAITIISRGKYAKHTPSVMCCSD